MSEADRQLGELWARQEIADCMYRYARGIDRGDVELVRSCYHEDSVDDHGFYVGPGSGLATEAISKMEGTVSTQHHITNHLVEVDGEQAHGETYYFVVIREKAGTTKLASGRYVDRFERRDGSWKIAARVCMVETTVEVPTIDMTATERTYAQGVRGRADLSYQRPLEVARRSATEPHIRPSIAGAPPPAV